MYSVICVVWGLDVYGLLLGRHAVEEVWLYENACGG